MKKLLVILLLITSTPVFAQQKMSEWTRITTPDGTDLLCGVNNPGSSPSNYCITAANLATYLGSGGASNWSELQGLKAAVNWADEPAYFSSNAIVWQGHQQVQTTDINWPSVKNLEVQRSGINWSDANLYPTSATGNFGIGESATTPTAILNVASTAAQDLFRVDDNGNGDVSPFVINLIGAVGIGTSLPTSLNSNYILTVQGDVNGARVGAMYNPNSGTSSQSRWEVRTLDSQGSIINFPTNYSFAPWAGRTMLYGETGNGVAIGAATGDIAFFTGATTQRVTIGTNIGIGTITPDAKVVITQTAAADSFKVEDQAVDSTPFIIDSTGNVGVGTAFPGAYLQVGNNGVIANDATFLSLGVNFSTSTPTPANAKIKLFDAGSGSYGFGVTNLQLNYFSGATDVDHVFYTGTTERMRIKGGGNVGIGTATVAGRFQVWPVATQVIASGNTISSNSCGSIKSISSASSVTTDTTNTFTAPATTQAGCCMRVVNVNASDTITLDNNANFKSAGAADVVLGSYDTAEVCSDGTAWFQVGSTGNN